MKKECLVFYLQVEAVEPSEGRLLLFSFYIMQIFALNIIHFLLNFNLGDLF